MDSGATAPPVVLTIAGFDPSSGAGVTADLQVFATHGLFGTACVTAVTVQSTVGVTRVESVDPSLLHEMLNQLTSDMPPAGVKVGMLGSAAVVRVVADYLDGLRDHARVPVVVDPILRSSSGMALLEADAMRMLLEQILPSSTCVTPNRTELAALLGFDTLDSEDLVEAARELLRRTGGNSVIVTGGEEAEPVDLVLERGQMSVWVTGEHVETLATHGTGCAFSSALLSNMVLGDAVPEAARKAKRFVEAGLLHAPGVGAGRGPMKLSVAPYRRRSTPARGDTEVF